MNFQRKFNFEFGSNESGNLLPDYSLDTSPLHEYHDGGFSPFPNCALLPSCSSSFAAKGTVQASDFQPALNEIT